jgi:RimJ/RimL family protein N-acetyltransferase
METIYLRSGRAVGIRPLRRDDRERLTAAYSRLSPESQYRRFLTVKPRLSQQDATYLVDVDGDDHMALVATPLDQPERIVAVARFVRLRENPRAAEFSIVIGDEFQGQGLGSALMARLIDTALERGVDRFVATVLADNLAAHALINRSVPTAPRWEHFGAVDEVEMRLGPVAALAA